MNNQEWRVETFRRFNLIVKYFKHGEAETILDFIRTGEDVSKEEAEVKTE